MTSLKLRLQDESELRDDANRLIGRISRSWGEVGRAEALNNARLFVASPDMLQTLRNIRDALNAGIVNVNLLRDAITETITRCKHCHKTKTEHYTAELLCSYPPEFNGSTTKFDGQELDVEQ